MLLCLAGCLSFLSASAGSTGQFPLIQWNDIVQPSAAQNDHTQFFEWTEKDYKAYEDSIFAALYPPVIAKKSDMPSNLEVSGNSDTPKGLINATNSYVPNTVALDKTKAVGGIVIHSGTSSTGGRTYSIPVEVYPGVKDFNPELSLAYNSQQGNGVAGIGWSISGTSMISRGGKSVYYDGKSEGVLLSKEDPFLLNGIRLIKLSETAGNIIYESEQGNIKVKAYLSGSVVKYFEVFYPEGIKGVFGYTSNTTNYLFYPLISLSDLKGNKIDYTYTYLNNHYRISGISYNGASVEFQYQTSRPDPVLFYSGGLKVYEDYLLQKIICKLGSSILGTYSLSYTTQNTLSLLTQIDYSAGGSAYNPIRIFYGENLTAKTYIETKTQLYEWYKSDDPGMIKVAKGKFDYDSGADGLISLPNQNPYWKHFRDSGLFKHSQNRFDNIYKGDEKIFLYAGLKDDWASPMPDLKTEAGFIDIFCADIEGQQEEYVIKVNDLVVNDNDQLTFRVYRSNLYNGLVTKYTRTYNFPTVFTDADGGKSIQPKFYHTGDFNGDGKMEVLAISCHQPFGDTSKPSKCYLFDLAGNKILYQNYVFAYNVDFIGTQQTDPKAAANNTDKVYVVDYDGDGKSDICHVNENGVNIYTFDVSGSTLTARKVATYAGLKKANLANRDLLIGEINGDGLIDLIVSPSNTATPADYTWAVYNSKGDGQFDKYTFSGTHKSSLANTGFIMQDINGDGMTDLLEYNTSGFFTYVAKNNNVGSSTCYESYPSIKSILIPTNINSHSYFNQLISLKEGIATKYSFTRNDGKEVLATGMANSMGVVEKNYYQQINEEGVLSGVYTKGYNAVFPYVNIHEPISVLASSDAYMNGSRIDWCNYRYNNAVLHRQGLGFRGFETVTKYNKRGQSLVQTYEPYRYSVLKSEEAPEFKKIYNFAVNIQANKTAKIRLSSKTEENKLKKISTSTSFLYDTYGNPTQETITYTGNITTKKTNQYAANTTIGDGYYLGFLTDQTVVATRNGITYTERMYIPSHASGLPLTKTCYVDGNQVKNQTFVYDAKGNITSEALKLYASTNSLTTSYIYDSYGRLSKVTNPLGLTNEYTYNATGRVATIKDHKGTSTTYTQDAFGREITVKLPDNSVRTTVYGWATEGTNGLYAITNTCTGKPTSKSVYDALNREVRTCETRFNGTIISIDKLYDIYGNPEKVSLPFPGSNPSSWNTYAYDTYNRITSLTEASGRKTTYSYNGNSTTTVEDKVSITRNFDAQNNLISVKDPAGTISYNLQADGQPSSIVAPGNVTTTFGYDKYRRRTSLTDPSQGVTSYVFDDAGNVIKETNANGKIIQSAYDVYNRLKTTTTPEFVTTYAYNAKDELTGVSTSNGTSKTFTYDAIGRLSTWKENAVDSKWLQKDYTYTSGNVSAIKYTSQSGTLATENYVYTNGHLAEMKLNGQTTVYKLSKENIFGQPTEILTGGITRKYDFTSYGLPSGRSATGSSKTYQNFSYTFDPATSNLSNRKDNIRSKNENFAYDGLNRLISYGGKIATYDSKGNLTQKSDVGSFEYANTKKPYAISGVTLSGNDAIPPRAQDVTYNSFWRPSYISENEYLASFIYNGDYDRVRMNLTKNGIRELTRYYIGSCYELDQTSSSTKEKLYLFGDFYNASAVYVKDSSGGKLYYILRDYLGSITQIVGSDGTLTQELSYDAWGRLRNPETQEAYDPGEEPTLFLGRGYTGHEHIIPFGIINMNARLYDPATGRFLSPDPYVQAPDFSQNFNRYAYAMNNPLRYVDENGESFILIACGVAALVGAITNVATHWKQIQTAGGGWNGFWKFTGYAITGGVAGAAGMAAGVAAAVGFAGVAGVTGATLASASTGFVSGAAVGAAGGATSGFILNTSNSLIEGERFGGALQSGLMGGLSGGILGGLAGGLAGGVRAAQNGRDFWTGKYTNRTLVQKAATIAEKNIGGKSAVDGTKKHEYATKMLRKYQKINGDRGLDFKVTDYDANGKKMILDVLDRKNSIIYDWKFGYPNKTPDQLNFAPQMQKYRDFFGLPSEVIKP